MGGRSGKRNPKYDTDFETVVRAQPQDLSEMKTTLMEVKDTVKLNKMKNIEKWQSKADKTMSQGEANTADISDIKNSKDSDRT